jgi:hypothetical protein
MESLTIPKDDYGYNLDFTIQKADGSEKVLTGYTIKLKMWKPGIPGTLLLDGTCTIDDADAGTCHYTIQEDDFDTKGRFHAELELTKAGVEESTEPFIIYVVESG